MTVAELIAELAKLDPTLHVAVSVPDMEGERNALAGHVWVSPRMVSTREPEKAPTSVVFIG